MLICLRVQRRAADEAREPSTFLYRFEQAEVLVGRSEAVEVRLPDAAISLVHFRIQRRRGGKLVIIDDGSTNGTFVDGVRLPLEQPKALRIGSRVVAGPYVVDLIDPQAQQPGSPTKRADTASFARQMVLEMMNALSGDAPAVVVVEGPNAGAELSLARDEIVVGRAEECDLTLSDSDCSRKHLLLRRRAGAISASDLGSKNGVLLERPGASPRRIEAEQLLEPDDELVLGQTRLRLRDAVACQLDALAKQDADTPDDPLAGLLDEPRSAQSAPDGEHEPQVEPADRSSTSDVASERARAVDPDSSPAARPARVAAPVSAAPAPRDVTTIVIIVVVVTAVAGAIAYLLI